jgi:predicted HTH transcriptional regulator
VLEYQETNGTAETESIASFSGGWSGNLYDFYTMVREKLVRAVFSTAQSGKIQSALCEALANALIHADYHGSRGIVILKQKEAVVFSNPGTFRIDVREAKNGGISDPRNAAIMKMFHFAGAGRGNGSGMPMIFHAWENRGWENPVVQELFSPNRTTLTLALGDGVESDRIQERRTYKEQILEYLTDHVTGTNADFRAVTGLSATRVILLIKDLLQEELIVAEGSHRSRVYRLKA